MIEPLARLMRFDSSSERCFMKSLIRLMAFALLISGMAAVSYSQDAKDAPKPILEKVGELTEKDEVLFKKGFATKFNFTMEKNKVYRIDVTSPAFQPLVVLKPDGGPRFVAGNARGADNGKDARLIFKAPLDGAFEIYVTSLKAGETGKFNLMITEPTRTDLLRVRAQGFEELSKADKIALLAEMLEFLDERGKQITPGDAGMVMSLGYELENSDLKGISDTFRKFARALSASDSKDVRDDAKFLEGAARRNQLLKNTMDIKGLTIADKDFDWAKYKGKVVLVDFWATWCGPCVREIPRLKKLYAEYHDKGFEIVGISGDREAEPLEKFMAAKEIPWECLYDKNAKRQPMVDYYGIFAFPTCILVGRDGKVISMEARGPELERLLEQQFEAK